MPSRLWCRATLAFGLSAAVVGYGVGASPAAQATVPPLVAAARQALGGEARLSSIRSFVLKGQIKVGSKMAPIGSEQTARHADDKNNVYGTFEIDCELPDRFVKTEDILPGYTGGTPVDGLAPVGTMRPVDLPPLEIMGFNGDRALAGTSGSPRSLALARAAFVNITLGMFASSFAGLPLTFADSTSANGVVVGAATKDATFSAVLTFDPATHLPASLNDFTYRDWRDVDGVKVPFLMTAALESLAVIDVKFNPVLDAKLFRAAGR